METQALLAPGVTSPPGQSRARVLDLLRAAGWPLGVHEVADCTGLHPNTARFHLDRLVEAGLATRERQARATPGRPGMAYRAADDGGLTGERRHRLLTQMLTTLITGMMPDPGRPRMRFLPHRTVPPPAVQRRGGHRAARCAHRVRPMHCSSDKPATGQAPGCCPQIRPDSWPGNRFGPTRGTPRRYSKEDLCANTAAAKPWPPSAN